MAYFHDNKQNNKWNNLLGHDPKKKKKKEGIYVGIYCTFTNISYMLQVLYMNSHRAKYFQ